MHASAVILAVADAVENQCIDRINCEYAADAAKDFHNHGTTIHTVSALPPIAFRFVDFFGGALFGGICAQLYVVALQG